MPVNRLLLERTIKEEYDRLLNEFVVPVTYSLSKWKKYRKENNITNAEYHKEHPETKWKVVHGHKEGEIGKSLKGLSNISYEKATKAHAAIEISKLKREQIEPITGSAPVATTAAETPEQKLISKIIGIISKNTTLEQQFKLIDTTEKLSLFLSSIAEHISTLNGGKLTSVEVAKGAKQTYTQASSIKAP